MWFDIETRVADEQWQVPKPTTVHGLRFMATTATLYAVSTGSPTWIGIAEPLSPAKKSQ